MRKLGKELVENLVAALRDTDSPVEYGANYVRVRNGACGIMCTVRGYVWMAGLWGNSLPFDWQQRRSIARAARWRHKIEQERLIELGMQAAREAREAKRL